MSTDGNTRIYEEEWDSVLDECPEYSDPESYQYDLDWCRTLAITRLEREEEES